MITKNSTEPTIKLEGEALRRHLANEYCNSIGTQPIESAATLPTSGSKRFDLAALILVASQASGHLLEAIGRLPL